MNNSSSAAKITQLEFDLAHQQRLCEQLNEVVTDHTRHIMKLERSVVELQKQLKDIQQVRKQDGPPLQDERPPHY